MRLVIRNRPGAAASGMGRYPRGSGILGSLARKLFSTGFRKVINVASKANLQQKLANVVVNGARSAGQSLGKRAGAKLGSVVRKKVVNKIIPKKRFRKAAAAAAAPKRPRQQRQDEAKRRRLDRFINHQGSGILLQ